MTGIRETAGVAGQRTAPTPSRSVGPASNPPIVLVTGVGRRVGIAAGIALRLAKEGWDVATSHWTPYDERVPLWDPQPEDPERIGAELRDLGARTVQIPCDLEPVGGAAQLFDAVEKAMGGVTALVLSHCESIDGGLMETTVQSFDRHVAVNARASWLLIREFAGRYRGVRGAGRIVALTSDAVVGNLAYGASKGALDRIVRAAARELADQRITANLVNPGPIDTGWMRPDERDEAARRNPRGRLGSPADTAALVAFLLSRDGEWINGQLLHSNGGVHAPEQSLI